MQTFITETATLKDTIRAYPGGRFFFRLTSEETNGALAIIDVTMIPGNEPARHYHEHEDETNIVINGTLTYFIGDEIIHARAGDMVFMPKGVPHNFKVTSSKASVRLIVTPGGLENFFERITIPWYSDDMPSTGRASSKERIEKIVQAANEFGVTFI